MIEIFIFAIIFFLSYTGVEKFRLWSLRENLIDVPNERSSHSVPKPRGGGLLIVALSLLAYILYAFFWTANFTPSYLIGAAGVALVSWLDDRRSVAFGWRLLTHSLAAAIVIYELGYWEKPYMPEFNNLALGVGGVLLTFFWIVWMTNAYNFMDGIDGLAGIQAVSAGIGWSIVGKLLGFEQTAFYGGVLAFSSLGFLIHNWSPAKIFMGDVGSAFLGYTFAVMPLLARRENSADTDFLPLIAVVLLWLFLFDTLATLFRRLLKKQKIWRAHREHLYQRMIIGGNSHRSVAILYGALSMFNLIMLVLWVAYEKNFGYIIGFIILAESAVLVLIVRKPSTDLLKKRL